MANISSALLCAWLWSTGLGRAQDAQFTSVLRLSNRELALKFNAPIGVDYRIDAATNLTATNPFRWNSLLTLRSAGVNQHTDGAAPYVSSRFYRAEQLPGTNLTGDHLVTTNGDVVIHPVGHASFVMRWNEKWIYNDPTNAPFGYEGFAKADLILISHSHGDHYSAGSIGLLRSSNGVIIVPQAVYDQSSFAPYRSNAIVLSYGTSTNVMGVTVQAVAGYNGNHAVGINNAYVTTIGGRRIFTSGDTADTVEIMALTNIDVAFIAMNLPFTMDARGATNIARRMRPRVVYPYHYRNQNGLLTNAPTFKQWLGTDLGIEVRLRKWY